jgi:CelD/BcsL family acetyltransferase involved in cellulose biosynthesis
VARSVSANTFLTFEWLSAWWTSYQIKAELFLIVIEDDDGKLMGIAPLVIKQVRKYGLVFRALYFLGDGTFETDHMNFIARIDFRKETLEALLHALERYDVWDVAHLNQIPQESQNGSDLIAWIERKNYRSSIIALPCPVRTLPDNFEALIASMQPRARTTLRSTRKKLESKYKVEFGLHNSKAEFAEALEALYCNHASRWGAKGQAGVFADPRRRDFYKALTEGLHARGWLRFFYLKLDGKIVAQEFCFEFEGTIYLLQEGFDYARSAENVGNMLRGHVFEYLITEGKKTYDFLEGVSRHKLIWSDGMIHDLRVTFCKPGWKGWIYYHAPLAMENFKRMVKKTLPAWAKQRLGIKSDIPKDAD